MMKNVRFVVLMLVMALVLGLSAVAGAAPSTDNPYKDVYKNAAAEIRKPGTAQVVFLVLNERKQPLAGATLVYNTTKARDLKAVTDAEGKVVFSSKVSDLYYLRELIVDGTTIPVSGACVADIGRNDIHRGTVRWYVVQQYSRSFVSYNGN